MVLRAITIAQCESIAETALGFRTALEVKKYLRRQLGSILPRIDKVIS
jgi:hypothetical protein